MTCRRLPLAPLALLAFVLCGSAAPAAPIAPAAVTPGGRDASRLSFAERVAEEETLLRILARHAGVAPDQFRALVPRDVAEKRVRTSLALSEALGAWWNTPITTDMLDAEVRRMTRNSVMPERLRERFAALGDDPMLIREVIARPALADRLARNFFDRDRRVQDLAWRRATELREDLATGRLDPRAPRTGREGITPAEIRREEVTIDMTAPAPGVPSPVTEEADRLIVDVPLEARGDRWLAARYTVAKRSWDEWWDAEAPRYEVESLSSRGTAAAGKLGGAVRADGAPEAPSPADLARLETTPSCAPDTWSVLHGGAPDALRDSGAVWTGSLMLIWGGPRQNAPGWRYDPAIDYWSPMRQENAPPYASQAAAVWTGTRFIVWGGTRTGSDAVASGGIYDPIADSWTPTTMTGAPAARYGHTGVWTGSKMIIWGGVVPPSFAETATGGAYDPALDQWTATQVSGAPTPRARHTAVWTGSAMLVWGGCAAGPGCFSTGASYDPQIETWSPFTIAGGPPPSARGRHTAVWTGGRMIVWGGGNALGTVFQTGGIYDPVSGWTPTTTANAPVARQDQSGVWTGSRMIVWGGRSAGVNPESSGGSYDPGSDTWSGTTTTNAPQGRTSHVAVWTGSRMIVWGGAAGQQQVPINSGGRYDPVSDSWTPTYHGSQAAFGPSSPFTAWTGNQLLIWGGGSTSGGLYDPATDVWSYTTAGGIPLAGQSVVWTGSKLLTWGGFYTTCCQCPPGGTGSYQVYTNGGASYDPLTNVWSGQAAVLPLPEGRAYHTAVWDGKEMIVWGGYRMIPCNGPTLFPNGFRYNPQTGVYTPLPTTGAPPTGFGVQTPAGYLTDEGVLFWALQMGPYLYHRDSDSWTRGATTGTPNAGYTAFGGGHLIALSANPTFPDGGRYNVIADAWRPVSESDLSPVCPPGVTGSSGTEMFWWGGGGGQNCNFSTDTGFHYDPVADTWAPTSMVDAPPASRALVSGVWTGERILWWDAGAHLGFAYCTPGTGPCYRDADGDGLGDPGASAQCNEPGIAWNALDCNDNSETGGLAGEASGVMLTSTFDISWSAPATPAGATFYYDLLRSSRADDLSGAACVATDLQALATTDFAVPAPGSALYYLVRASTCPGGAVEGTLGKGSPGSPGRFGPACP